MDGEFERGTAKSRFKGTGPRSVTLTPGPFGHENLLKDWD
jgi:hypothetical protein